MKIHWSYRSVPELAHLSAPEFANLVRGSSENQAVRKATVIGLAVCGMCAGLGSVIGDYFLSSGIWGAAVGGGIGGFLFSQIKMRAIFRFLQKSLSNSPQTPKSFHE